MTIHNQTINLINAFLKAEFLLSITCHNSSELWSANCFYIAYLNKKQDHAHHLKDVFYMSSLNSLHSKMLEENTRVSGTIAKSTRDTSKIEGIQYLGIVSRVKTDDQIYEEVLRQYQNKFIEAKEHTQPLWQLKFTKVKYTRNTPKFGEKFLWQSST